MSAISNDYSRFYAGTEQLKSYGSNPAMKKDTLVKYRFDTTDENGNKVMEKMSKEEMFQAMKDIRSQYGYNVILEFSGDGMAALIESKKGAAKGSLSDEEMAARNAAFQKGIVHNDISANHLPAYSGMYEDDKTVAAALENCKNEEKAFVYDIIRQNFLVENSSSMTEEERQANIASGVEKAKYAAENFLSEDKRGAFLEAMENIAKLASAGKADKDGNMDYGVSKAKYLGHGGSIVRTTNAGDMMKRMDSAAYEEYKKLSGIDSLKYLMKWYEDALKKTPTRSVSTSRDRK